MSMPDAQVEFAHDALDGNVGKTIRLNVEGGAPTEATIVAVAVDDDGRGCTLTLEVPDELVRRLGLGTYSIDVGQRPIDHETRSDASDRGE